MTSSTRTASTTHTGNTPTDRIAAVDTSPRTRGRDIGQVMLAYPITTTLAVAVVTTAGWIAHFYV